MPVPSQTEKDEASRKDGDSERKLKALFSWDEKVAIVKGFLRAYIGGYITINFPSTAEILPTVHREFGEKIDYKEAAALEHYTKDYFGNLLNILSGSVAASPDELERGVNDMFQRIFQLRQGGRIEGTFLGHDVEQSIVQLSQDVAELKATVARLERQLERTGI